MRGFVRHQEVTGIGPADLPPATGLSLPRAIRPVAPVIDRGWSGGATGSPVSRSCVGVRCRGQLSVGRDGEASCALPARFEDSVIAGKHAVAGHSMTPAGIGAAVDRRTDTRSPSGSATTRGPACGSGQRPSGGETTSAKCDGDAHNRPPIRPTSHPTRRVDLTGRPDDLRTHLRRRIAEFGVVFLILGPEHGPTPPSTIDFALPRSRQNLDFLRRAALRNLDTWVTGPRAFEHAGHDTEWIRAPFGRHRAARWGAGTPVP